MNRSTASIQEAADQIFTTLTERLLQYVDDEEAARELAEIKHRLEMAALKLQIEMARELGVLTAAQLALVDDLFERALEWEGESGGRGSRGSSRGGRVAPWELDGREPGDDSGGGGRDDRDHDRESVLNLIDQWLGRASNHLVRSAEALVTQLESAIERAPDLADELAEAFAVASGQLLDDAFARAETMQSLEDIHTLFDEIAEAMEILGNSAEELAAAEERRQEAIRDFLDRAAEGIRSLYDELTSGRSNLSNAGPREALAAAEEEFETLAARLAENLQDAEALAMFDDAARQYLEAAQALDGTGPLFDRILRDVLANLEEFKDPNAEDLRDLEPEEHEWMRGLPPWWENPIWEPVDGEREPRRQALEIGRGLAPAQAASPTTSDSDEVLREIRDLLVSMSTRLDSMDERLERLEEQHILHREEDIGRHIDQQPQRALALRGLRERPRPPVRPGERERVWRRR